MPNTKIFRQTPFNGYNRDDVTKYLVEQDKAQKAVLEEKERCV